MAEEITALKNEGEEELITQTELMQKNIGTELVVKAIGGDEDAFEQLYMLSYRYVFAVARHYLKKDEDIYDAIQDTYTRVYKNLSKLNEPEAFAYWLRKIAENCSKTVRDRKTVDGDLELFEAEFVSGEDELGRKDVELDITEVLSELQPDQAELLTRVYYDKLTVAEIARMQGKPKSTVYGQFKAANKKLKELLKIRGIDKPVYGGDAVAMITTMFRNAIGTDLLSATVAHEILENVRGKDSRGGAVITAVAKKERNAAVLRLAGIMIASALFFALLIFGGYMIVSRLTDSGEVAAGGNDMNFWGPLFGQNSSSDSPSEPNFWDKLFGSNSSSEEASSDDVSSSSGTSSEPSNHTSSDESSSTEGSASSGNSSSSGASGSSSNNSSSHNSSSQINKPSVNGFPLTPSAVEGVQYYDFPVISGDAVTNRSYNYYNVAKSGGYIYYSGFAALYRMKTDGSEKQAISDIQLENVCIYKDWVYGTNTDGIYRLKTNGSGFECVFISEEPLDFVIIGDYALWTVNNNDRLQTYALNIPTGEAVKTMDGLWWDNNTAIRMVKDLISWQVDPPGYALYRWGFFGGTSIILPLTNYYDAPFGFIDSEKKIIVDTGSKVDIYDANTETASLLYSGNGKLLYYDEYNNRTAAVYNGQAYIVETGAKLNWSSEMLNKVSSNNLKFDVLDDGYAYATDSANGILYKVSLDGSKVTTY